MRGLIWGRVLPAAAVALAVAGAAGLTMLNHSVTLASGARNIRLPVTAPVSAATRACPAPGLPRASASRIAIVTAPGGGAGRAAVSRLTASTAGVLSLSRPGVLAVRHIRPARSAPGSKAPAPAPSKQPIPSVPTSGGVVVQATGAMARGLEAEQVSTDAAEAAHCASPGTDFWFVGPGRSSAAHIQLFLANPGGEPADVNVEADTDAGPLQGGGDTGIAVAPHSMITQSLDGMLRGSKVIALHVRTSVGQIVAALQERAGATSGGVWLPPAAVPATKVFIPGLPPAAGTRQLFLTVPGSHNAHIVLTAVTSKGSYQPTGGAGLDIPGGSAVAISLPSLSGVAGALKVSATVPVTASMMVPGAQHGALGVFTAAAAPVQELGMVAVSLNGAGKASELVLSAPGNAVRARITKIGQGASTVAQPPAADSSRTVQLAARHSLVVPLARPSGTKARFAFAVAVTPLPGSGPLYAGRVLASSGAGGPVLSILPVPSAPASVALTPVRMGLITRAP